MASLPSLDMVDVDEDGKRVWLKILSAEKAAVALSKTISKYQDPLIGIRIVGFLLQDLWQHREESLGITPYQEFLKSIGNAIASVGTAEAQHKELQGLGLHYRNHLFRVFRSNAGPLPTQSDHPSRTSLDAIRDKLLKDMKTPTTGGSARTNALLRDGQRCMITGSYDLDSIARISDIFPLAQASTVKPSFTQCAHIFSETAQDGEYKAEYAAAAMAILQSFGVHSITESLLGKNVHQYFNILTMRSDLHTYFDRLEFWLEEVSGMEDTYKIAIAPSKRAVFSLLDPLPERVTFQVDPDLVRACHEKHTKVPALPSRSLLAVRAACSRVAHLSGAAEQVQQILRDLEDTSVMAEDGGSAHLLEFHLAQSSCTVNIKA